VSKDLGKTHSRLNLTAGLAKDSKASFLPNFGAQSFNMRCYDLFLLGL